LLPDGHQLTTFLEREIHKYIEIPGQACQLDGIEHFMNRTLPKKYSNFLVVHRHQLRTFTHQLHTRTAAAIMMPTTNKRSKTSNDDSSDINATQKRLLVPTFTNKKDTEELDLSSMTEEELKLLQKKCK